MIRSSWMISHLPSGWVNRKYSADSRCNLYFSIVLTYVYSVFWQCAGWYLLQVYLLFLCFRRESCFRFDVLLRAVGNACHLGMSHTCWNADLFDRQLFCRLLTCNRIDLNDWDSLFSFKSGRLSWWELGMVSPAQLTGSSRLSSHQVARPWKGVELSSFCRIKSHEWRNIDITFLWLVFAHSACFSRSAHDSPRSWEIAGSSWIHLFHRWPVFPIPAFWSHPLDLSGCLHTNHRIGVSGLGHCDSSCRDWVVVHHVVCDGLSLSWHRSSRCSIRNCWSAQLWIWDISAVLFHIPRSCNCRIGLFESVQHLPESISADHPRLGLSPLLLECWKSAWQPRLITEYFYHVFAHLRRQPSGMGGFLLCFCKHLVDSASSSSISSFQWWIFSAQLFQVTFRWAKHEISRSTGHFLDDISHAFVLISALEHWTGGDG